MQWLDLAQQWGVGGMLIASTEFARMDSETKDYSQICVRDSKSENASVNQTRQTLHIVPSNEIQCEI